VVINVNDLVFLDSIIECSRNTFQFGINNILYGALGKEKM
jgi:hypothetical protein